MTHGDARLFTAACLSVLLAGSSVSPAAETKASRSEGLLAHWSLDETKNDGLPDASGNAHHGAALNSPTPVAGVLGGGLYFNGTDQAVSIAHTPQLEPSEQITLSAWILPRTLAGVHHVYRKEDGDDRHLLAFQAAGSVLALGLSFAGTYRELDVPIRAADYLDGRWHLVTATYDGAHARMYRDGRRIGSMPITGSIGTTGTAPAFIGSDKGTESFFDGCIDDVRLYARALTQDEINALYEDGAASAESSGEALQHVMRKSREAAQKHRGERLDSSLAAWRKTTAAETLQPLELTDRAARCMDGFLRRSPRRLPGPQGFYRPAFGCALLPSAVIAHGQGMMGRWECGDLTSRAILAWIAMREMTGDLTTGRDVEQGERDYLLFILHPETGLAFVPELSDRSRGKYQYHSWDQSRALRALVRWYETVPADRARLEPFIRRLIRGLDDYSDIRGTDATWGPYACWSADEFDQDHEPVPHPFDKNAFPDVGELIPDPAGSSIEGLVMFAELTDDAEALDLAVRFTHGELGQHRSDKFAPDQKRFAGFAPDGTFAGHLHSKTTTLLGIAKLAGYLAEHGRRDQAARYLRQIRKTYDWMFAADNPTRGSRIGWFRERPRGGGSEMCGTADVIELAVAMAACARVAPEFHGWVDLYDDADSMTVNMIARTQIRFTPAFETLLAAHYGQGAPQHMPLARKLEGTWPTTVTPNDLAVGGTPTIPLSGCCQYAGVRALYSGWRGAIASGDGELRIDYFLNHRSKQAEMTTAMPAEGNARIILREAAHVSIRVPAWLTPERMKLTVNDRSIDTANRLDRTGHYAVLGRLAPATRIAVSFPLDQHTTTESIGGADYVMQWRGNYVVKIEPPGKHVPLFP